MHRTVFPKIRTLSGRAMLLGFFMLSIFVPQSADACTLWAAAGDAVAGKGTLVAKNRDWKPDNTQELRIVHPPKGYAFVSLFAVGGSEPGTKAGINQHGLAIVSATAGQYSRTERGANPQKPGLMRSLLAECASVDEVLAKRDHFRRPVFYLMADRTTVALLEIDRDGRMHVEKRHSGALSHTNHYCYLDSRAMQPPALSSTTRLSRIEQLLKEHKGPFTHGDFIRFSEDRNAGPDNSIWRRGSEPAKTRTLATWILAIPRHGSPVLYLKTADPGQPEKTCALVVDDALKMISGAIPLDSTSCKGVHSIP